MFLKHIADILFKIHIQKERSKKMSVWGWILGIIAAIILFLAGLFGLTIPQEEYNIHPEFETYGSDETYRYDDYYDYYDEAPVPEEDEAQWFYNYN